MAKGKISVCVTFALCLFLLVGFGWSEQSQNSNQNSIQAPESQKSLILRRFETVEKGKEGRKKSNDDSKKQVESLSKQFDEFKNEISSDYGLKPSLRGPPGKNRYPGAKGDRGLQGPKGHQGPKGGRGRPAPQSITSCSDAMKILPSSRSRKQSIYPHGNGTSLEVLCDFETDGGGWTIIQRRTSGPRDEFNKNWNYYAKGFGSLQRNFWMGLDNIRALTQNGDQELRIELEDFEGNRKYAKYSNFLISDASDFYRLTIGGFSGTAGDSMNYHNKMRFSTKDKDHDDWNRGNCAERLSAGGFWFNDCYAAALNGLYFEKGETVSGSGIYWSKWKGSRYSLAKTEMKIRTRT